MYKEDALIERVDDSETLWRYHDLPRYMDLLLRNQIFFNKIDQFEDPYEGALAADKTRAGKAVSVAVNTWHMNQEENYAMWNIYARGSYGLAIQTSFQKLKQAFNKTAPDVIIGKVSYVNGATNQHAKTPAYFRKRSIYAFENEVRCCTLLEDSAKTLDAQGTYTGVFVDIDLKTLIESIFISPYSPEWFRDLVSRINVRFGIDADILHSSVFEIDNIYW